MKNKWIVRPVVPDDVYTDREEFLEYFHRAAQAEVVRGEMKPKTLQMWIFAHNGLNGEAEVFARERGILWSSRKEFDELLVHLGLRPLPDL
ncbi:hypothetical protein QUF72_09055 [Desulfobacterales bacterium HSG2]|nr:hypothetical protein [Desulfobacterales bacterium HSG2]